MSTKFYKKLVLVRARTHVLLIVQRCRLFFYVYSNYLLQHRACATFARRTRCVHGYSPASHVFFRLCTRVPTHPCRRRNRPPAAADAPPPPDPKKPPGRTRPRCGQKFPLLWRTLPRVKIPRALKFRRGAAGASTTDMASTTDTRVWYQYTAVRHSTFTSHLQNLGDLGVDATLAPAPRGTIYTLRN